MWYYVSLTAAQGQHGRGGQHDNPEAQGQHGRAKQHEEPLNAKQRTDFDLALSFCK